MTKAKFSFFRSFLCISLTVLLLISLMPHVKAYNMTASENLVTFIKRYEGFSATAYADAGGYSIGYGTNCDPSDYPNGISQTEADILLRQHLSSWVEKVNSFALKYGISFSQCQFDALCSMCYNMGGSWLDEDCRITKYFKGTQAYTEQDMMSAFAAYCHSQGKVLSSLLNRRMDEACMFLYGDYNSSIYKSWRWAIVNTNGGSINPNATIFCFRYGQVYGNLPTPVMTGLTFRGWQTASGTYVTNNDIVSSNLYLYAAYGSDASNFSDVKAKDWYYEYVICLTGEGILSGYSDGKFHPSDEVKLGQAVCMLLKAVGYPELKQDPKEYWSQVYIDFAESKGFLKDIEDLNPKRVCSRDEIAHILCNMLGYTTTADSPFADTDSVYASTMYEYTLMEGSVSSDGTRNFMPDTSITRAAMSVLIYKIPLVIW